MKLSEICVERPVFAWVMTAVIILVGLVLGNRLPLQHFPKIEYPAVTVETTMPGAAPEIVEAQITRKLEEAFAGGEAIDYMVSTSNTNSSHITIYYGQSRNIDDAVNEVRDRVSKEKDNLPHDAKEPIITKIRSDEGHIIAVAFSSETMGRDDLFDFVSQELKKEFEAVPGVGRVEVFGSGLFVMNLYIDPRKMASYGIAVTDVIKAIKSQNLEVPAGSIISKNREYLVTTVANLERPEEFENMIVLSKNGKLVRFSDIGRAEIESAKSRTRSYFNGQRGVSIAITKQSNVNPISVARGVKKTLENVKKTNLPPDVKAVVSYDSTQFVERAIKEVYRTIIEAIFLVTLVVLLFLKSFKAALIPLVTIPVSIIGTLTFMHLFHFTLNIFTLLAFVLAVGLVVDDAIVVLENTHRYMEKGYSRLKAAIFGIREVSFAIVAMTLTLAAVYTPVALASGKTGKLLTEFSITLACAVILSGFAALTLSPMMCARLLDSPADEDRRRPLGRRFRDKIPVEAFMERMSRSYENLLRKTLNRKIAVLLGAFSLGGLGFLMYKVLPSQFLPKEDAGMIWFEGHSPQSSTIDYTERYVQKLDKILAEIPDVASRDISITNPTFKGYIELKKDRKRSSEAVAEEVRIKFDEVTGVEVLKMQAGYGGSGGDSSTVSFVVRGNKSHKELRELGIAVGREVMYAGLAKSLLTVSKNDTEDYTVTILRDKVLSMFIEPATIADTIDALIRGRKVNTFKKDNKLYDVKVEVENESRSTPEDILNIYVKGGERGEKLVPLSELILLTPRSGPVDIHHYNGTRSVEITNILESRYGVNDGIKHVELVKNEILPKDVVLEFTGGTKEYLKESRVMGMVFGLALIFIYLVMAAQFESWRDPLIILFSVPLAIASALITLGLIKNGSLNLYSNIGLITLIGLITKHGILLVDFANKKQLQENLSVTQAIVQAGLVRLRPVVMTTLAMVLGNLPLAFATGAGAETRWQLGWTIVGGMTLGTIFTMFIVPIFYLLFSKVKEPMVLEEEGIPEGVVASLG